jgi:hypothetical protein
MKIIRGDKHHLMMLYENMINKKIEKRDNKSVLLNNEKPINKSWEDELNEWMIEELFTPFQAS